MGRGPWTCWPATGALIVTCYASYALIRYALRSAELGSVSTYLSQTPLALPQGLLAASFVLLALALFAHIVRLLMGEGPEVPAHGAIE